MKKFLIQEQIKYKNDINIELIKRKGLKEIQDNIFGIIKNYNSNREEKKEGIPMKKMISLVLVRTRYRMRW